MHARKSGYCAMLAAVFSLACTSAPAEKDATQGEGETAGSSETGESTASGPNAYARDNSLEPSTSLSDGSHAVFGLRVPRGMTPKHGPNQVYRFEGTLALTHLKRYVMRQVETGTILREPSGYLIRKARVLNPAGDVHPGRLLAVRIFRGRRGGASMDVWVEQSSVAVTASEGGSKAAGWGGGGVAKDSQSQRPRLSASQVQRRAEQRKQTYKIIEALERGRKAPPTDPENPFYY